MSQEDGKRKITPGYPTGKFLYDVSTSHDANPSLPDLSTAPPTKPQTGNSEKQVIPDEAMAHTSEEGTQNLTPDAPHTLEHKDALPSMKNWEGYLSHSRQQELEERIADEERMERDEQDEIAKNKARMEKITSNFDQKAGEILSDLNIIQLLNDINEVEWEGKGIIIPYTNDEEITGYSTSSEGGLTNRRSVSTSYYGYQTGLQLIYEYDTEEGKRYTYTRVLVHFPKYKDSNNLRFVHLHETDPDYIRIEAGMNDSLLEPETDEDKRRIKLQISSIKSADIQLNNKNGTPKNNAELFALLFKQLALECEHRKTHMLRGPEIEKGFKTGTITLPKVGSQIPFGYHRTDNWGDW